MECHSSQWNFALHANNLFKPFTSLTETPLSRRHLTQTLDIFTAMYDFKWTPGDGYSEIALSRLVSHFSMPKEPMGEAWFMGDTRFMFDYLKSNLNDIPVEELMKPLEEISTGTSSFGYLEEWSLWCHYLLGRLIPRSHECYIDYLLEYLITAFITQYPEGIEKEPYKGFRDDMLCTLGKCIMDDICWDDEEIVIGRILCPSNNNPNRVWCWWDASGDISSSIFFCLKYLPAQEISGWFKSVLTIQSPHWRAQLIVWLVGAHGILNKEIKQPSELEEDRRPAINWAWSHILDGDYSGEYSEQKKQNKQFIPEENRLAILKVLSETINEDMYLEWLDSIAQYDYLESELAEIPERFAIIYIYEKNT